MTDREQKLAYLKEAEAQYHALVTGQAASVFVDQNGERVEYAKTDLGSLRAYINSLKLSLGISTVGGPLRPWM